MMPVDGTGAPQLLLHSEHGERAGALSWDSKWIAYDSTESGRREVWIQPVPPNGSRRQVSSGGGFGPQWREDGRELFYVAADGQMMAVAITPGRTPIVGAVTPLFQTLRREGAAGFRVSPDGTRFLISRPPDLSETDPITVIVNWRSTIRR
jgi:serine/threonine-protein kinase